MPLRVSLGTGAATVALIGGIVLIAPLGAAASVGSHAAWTERFPTDVALGSVGADGSFPGYSDGEFWAYRDGLSPKYRPSQVNSIRDHVLTWTLSGDGMGSSVTVGPSAVGGEWSVRMRTDAISGIHIANMLWPDNNVWPGTNGSGGEIDYPESDTDESNPYFAVVADAGLTRNGSQAFNPAARTTVPQSWHEWHTYTTDVVPGVSVTVYQDGVLIGEVTDNVPRTPIHEQFQVEPSQEGIGGSGTVQLSAVAYSPDLDHSTIAAVGGPASASASPTATPTASASPIRSVSPTLPVSAPAAPSTAPATSAPTASPTPSGRPVSGDPVSSDPAPGDPAPSDPAPGDPVTPRPRNIVLGSISSSPSSTLSSTPLPTPAPSISPTPAPPLSPSQHTSQPSFDSLIRCRP